MDKNTVYEQPLNERIRSFLRLEHLFQIVATRIVGDSEFDSRAALVTMIDITDMLTRTDIKTELIKELERHATTLSALQQRTGVNQGVLEEALSQLNTYVSRLRDKQCQPGNTLKHDELVSLIRQRVSIPGGTCNFDVPAYHYWLASPIEIRTKRMQAWFADLVILQKSIELILGIIRTSASPEKITAKDGFYQRSLESEQSYQMVRIVLPADRGVYPEVSGGKHRFSIRFMSLNDSTVRPTPVQNDVAFKLYCCNM